jgi:hypothetical protein
MRRLVFPNDPEIRELFGRGLNEDPHAAKRAFRARLDRAQASGVLPARVYISPRRFGWDRAELETALAQLPRTYAGFTSAGHSPHAA